MSRCELWVPQRDPAKTAPGSIPEHVGPSSGHTQPLLKVLDPSLQAARFLGMDLDPAGPIGLLGSLGHPSAFPPHSRQARKRGSMPLGEVGNRESRAEGRAPRGQAGLASEDVNGASTRMGALGPDL